MEPMEQERSASLLEINKSIQHGLSRHRARFSVRYPRGGRFRLICWQNNVGGPPIKETRAIYIKVGQSIGRVTPERERRKVIGIDKKSPAISYRYGGQRRFIVSRAKPRRATPPRLYISRVRGETSISLDQSLIRPETPNT